MYDYCLSSVIIINPNKIAVLRRALVFTKTAMHFLDYAPLRSPNRSARRHINVRACMKLPFAGLAICAPAK